MTSRNQPTGKPAGTPVGQPPGQPGDEPSIDFRLKGKDLGPFCPWYVDDFLGGTTYYDATLVGAYHLLLLHQWSNGFIPKDSRACQTIARCDADTVEQLIAPQAPETPKFTPHSCGGLINRRMADIRNERISHMLDQRRKSELGVAARKVKQQPTGKPTGTPVGKPPGQPAGKPEGKPHPSPSPSPPPTEEKEMKVLSSSSGGDRYQPLKHGAGFADIISHLQKSHAEFGRTPEGAIIASLNVCRADRTLNEIIDGINDMIRHYAGDAPLGMPATRRLETYILGPMKDRKKAKASAYVSKIPFGKPGEYTEDMLK